MRRLDGAAFGERIDLPADDRSFVAGRPEALHDLLDLVRRAQQVGIGDIT